MNNWVKKAFHTPSFIILFCIASVLILIPVFAPILAPNDPVATDYGSLLQRGSRQYPLGTDQIGRCILSRLIYGGRTSLLVVFAVIFLSVVLGLGLGILAGYLGGMADQVISFLVNIMMSVPATVFVIAYVGMMGSGLLHTVEAMVLTGWCAYARISRTLVLSIKNNTYIDEARLGGAGPLSLLFQYILPNMLPYFVVIITQDIGEKLLSLAGLSLLGLASQPPVPEWGFMLSEGRRYMQTAPWMILYPGIWIVFHVVVFSLLGDCLRDILQPDVKRKRKKRRKNRNEKESFGRFSGSSNGSIPAGRLR